MRSSVFRAGRACACALASAIPLSAWADPSYTGLGMGGERPGVQGVPQAMNVYVDMAGYAHGPSGREWGYIGNIGNAEVVRDPGAWRTRMLAINRQAVGAGWTQLTPGSPRVAIKRPPKQPVQHLFPDAAVDASSWATGISDNGVIVGARAAAAGAPWQAFEWHDGDSRALPSPDGGESVAHAVNLAGVVVGSGSDAGGCWHAVRWTMGVGADLARDPGARCDEPDAAFAVNASGAAVGQCSTAGGPAPCEWLPDGTLVRLPDLGVAGGKALSISDDGAIVGTVPDAQHRPSAVVFLPDHAVVLDSVTSRYPPDSHIEQALTVLVGGAILARGRGGDGVDYGWVLKPE